MFLQISEISQENTCVGFSLSKGEANTGVFASNLRNV